MSQLADEGGDCMRSVPLVPLARGGAQHGVVERRGAPADRELIGVRIIDVDTASQHVAGIIEQSDARGNEEEEGAHKIDLTVVVGGSARQQRGESKGLDDDNVAALVECLFTIDADNSNALSWGEFIVGLREIIRVATSE